MNRKMLTIILAVVLIASFFLPLFSAGSESAFDLVQAKSYGSEMEILLRKYLWLLIPISGLILLIGALNNGQYAGGRALWAILPLLVVIYMIVKPLMDGVKVDSMVKEFGVGFWLMIVGAIVLAVYHPKK